MLAPDIGAIIIATLAVFVYNAIMTCIFIAQRYDLNKLKWKKRLAALALPFMTSIMLCLFLSLIGSPGVWLTTYFIAITLLVIIDRILKHKIHQ
jgi:multisubunit Na+/H+ antiporter MnhB subunit